MTVKRTGLNFLRWGLVAAFILVGSWSALAALTGAIFTTNMNGAFVNGNVYDRFEDVYLNGGPRPNAPCTAAGLPDGDYYFQVTDPSGKVLLSSDHPVTNRKVTVSGGVIVAYNGTHINGVGKCSSITIQLSPYAKTPNPGAEYKVWMTRVQDYDTTATLGSFGFIPSKTKTDNFKVIRNVDSDKDGIPDDTDACPLDPDPGCGIVG